MPTKLVVNCTTGEQTEVEMTAEEIAQREIDAANAAVERLAIQQKMEARETAKASAVAKLAALGLTAEEIAAL
jgi:DNA-directed RNA polymerase specialized sigma24 family protein